MRKFTDEDFLPANAVRHRYHDYAKTLPGIDSPCHISAKRSMKTGALKTLFFG